MTRKANLAKTYEAEIRRHALAYPETREDHPWGETAIKVKEKAFVFMRYDKNGLSVGVKLPHSNRVALKHPFCEPTHYGMGKFGWVTAAFAPGDDVPMKLLKEWIDESFRAVAPKTLVKKMDAPASTAAKTKAKAKRSRPRR